METKQEQTANFYEEFAKQCKADGMTQDEILCKLEDMGYNKRFSEVLVEQLFS